MPQIRIQKVKDLTTGSSQVRILNQLDAVLFKGYPQCPKKGHWWIVWADNKPVGFGGLTELGFLARAGIDKKFRGRGLHKKLIAARIAYGKKLNLPKLYTYVYIKNSASLGNLLKLGFTINSAAGKWINLKYEYKSNRS